MLIKKHCYESKNKNCNIEVFKFFSFCVKHPPLKISGYATVLDHCEVPNIFFRFWRNVTGLWTRTYLSRIRIPFNFNSNLSVSCSHMIIRYWRTSHILQHKFIMMNMPYGIKWFEALTHLFCFLFSIRVRKLDWTITTDSGCVFASSLNTRIEANFWILV